jgi:1-acyl-sn-glycerol-3-phosphate acyltransferase
MIGALRFWFKLFAFAVVLIWHFIRLMISVYLGGKHPERGLRIRRDFCRSALSVLKIKVHRHNIHDHKGCLLISNHRSMLDPLVELAYINCYILSKSEVADYPLIGRGAKETGVLFVNRDEAGSRKAALQAIGKHLVDGDSILIYPEGTTQAARLTSEFRRGAFEVAFQNSIPVIPIMIAYPDDSYSWTDGSLMDYIKRVLSRPGTLHVRIQMGEPLAAENADKLMSVTRESIDQMILATLSK